MIKPVLPEPFPNMPRIWTCPITGFKVPKRKEENLVYRYKLLKRAQGDAGFQADLMAACRESFLFWLNAFVWTYHQFDVDEGKRIQAESSHCPFITWEVQDNLADILRQCLKNGEDILVNKSRDMGASWEILGFNHWNWQFRPDSQILEISRTEDYVDKSGNMKALFQRHDYINRWQPEWMTPPDVEIGGRNRTKMHMKNVLNGSCIDGESTTEHAASGDRRLIIMLDEFAKVTKNAGLIRSATRDAAFMRIVNSTVVGPETEYSKWKKSGKIKVFPLMWWDHPDKGKGRYVVQDDVTKAWKIRSPWYDIEEEVRSPNEMAREIDADDIGAGSTFFNQGNIDTHIALFVRKPDSRWNVQLNPKIANHDVKYRLKDRSTSACIIKRNPKGKLRWWGTLLKNRPDQIMDYTFGIDISQGKGASNSVISIKCDNTGEKVGEWRDANTPAYELPRIAAALALWIGGNKGLPFMVWEMNGPGWDFGRILVKEFVYPYYYKDIKPGNTRDRETKKYGWHNNKGSKIELLTAYERSLAHGGFINHCQWALDEARVYIYYPNGSIGPAMLQEENANAQKTHGDCVMADALANLGNAKRTRPRKLKRDMASLPDSEIPPRSPAARKRCMLKRRRKINGEERFDFR